jgi:tRNA(adenine34) deaminase
MQLALEEAANAEKFGDVPVGAIVVSATGQVLAKAGNRREQDCDPTAHAEAVALRIAAKKHGHWNLSGCTLYVTLEPCAMCAGAAVLSRVRSLVYGATDAKGGAISLGIDILQNKRLNHRLEIVSGILADDSKSLLQNFFKQRRQGT